MLERRRHYYLPLADPESPSRGRAYTKHVYFSVLAIVSCFMSFIAGLAVRSDVSLRDHLGHIPLGYVGSRFQYNDTFSHAPSAEASAAWNGLFPMGSGFVEHPTLSPSPSAVSAFHQLHCLNMLWLMQYESSSPASARNDSLMQGSPAGHEFHLGHARHCIEYLRQSIVCAADSNLEPVNNNLGGVTGWDSPRRCRDFKELVSWATQWKSGYNEGAA